MSHTPHELFEEFPDRVEQIKELKLSNAHFSRLYDEYHEINRKVHVAETDIKPTSDAHLEELRKQRLLLKDQLFAMLVTA